MIVNKKFLICLLILNLIIIYEIIKEVKIYSTNKADNKKELNADADKKELNEKLIELSQRLHKTLQLKGQLECEKSSNDVSKSGGWCSKISGLDSI